MHLAVIPENEIQYIKCRIPILRALMSEKQATDAYIIGTATHNDQRFEVREYITSVLSKKMQVVDMNSPHGDLKLKRGQVIAEFELTKQLQRKP